MARDFGGNQTRIHDGSAIADIDGPHHVPGDLGLDTSLVTNLEGLSPRLTESIACTTTQQAKDIVGSSGFWFGDRYTLIDDAYDYIPRLPSNNSTHDVDDGLELLLPRGREVILRGPMNAEGMNAEFWWAEIVIGNIQRMVLVRLSNLQKKPNHLKR